MPLDPPWGGRWQEPLDDVAAVDHHMQGPTYVVASGFNVFVCTVCSGHQ